MELVKFACFVFIVLPCLEASLTTHEFQLSTVTQLRGNELLKENQRKFIGKPICYYSNSNATFHLTLLLQAGDISPNPGPVHNGQGNAVRKVKYVTGLLFNARSIRNKLPELQLFLETNAPQMLFVTETWFSSNDMDSVLGIPQYEILRKDRCSGGRGGGILAAVSPSLSPRRLAELENDELELMWFSVKFQRARWLVGVLYRPPSSRASYWEKLQEAINSANIDNFDGCLMVGDFNVDFSAGSPPSAQRTSLDEIASHFGLEQLVSSITRPSNVDQGSTIDLVFTNCSQFVSTVDTVPAPVHSDHLAVQIEFRTTPALFRTNIVRSFLQFHQGDFGHLKRLLHLVPWSAFMDPQDPNASAEMFTDLFQAAVKDAIPAVSKRKSKFSPWITSDLRKLINKKHSLFRRARRSRLQAVWSNYCEVRNAVKKQSRKAYWSYVDNMFTSDDNRRRFWAYVRSRKKSPAPRVFHRNGVSLMQPLDISEAFNIHFASVFNHSVPIPEEPPDCKHPIPEFSSLYVSVPDIIANLSVLPMNKPPGPDGIHPRILRQVAYEVAYPLHMLFNISLRVGAVPDLWKGSNITPVYKQGNREDISNYRPVALTSVLCKCLERLVMTAVKNHMTTFALWNPNQHGFMKKRSCVTQLINVMHEWSSILDRPKAPRIDVAFCDMSKAFDKMPHDLLLTKLARDYNFRGPMWQWIKSFLTPRRQRVLYQGATSSWKSSTSGIPQGSVFGPTLFNMFVNDVQRDISSKTLLFADDILIFRPIHSAQDEVTLQSDLVHLLNWCRTNQMSLNPSKTKILHVTRRRNAQPCKYTLDGQCLSSVPSHKYLGVLLSSDLRWNSHVDSIVLRANRLLGFIRTIAHGASSSAIFALYRSLVLPILEYGIPSWHPHTAAQEHKLETVQRNATRMALHQRRGEMSYEERLDRLHWTSLSSRRDYALCSFTMKCLSGMIQCEAITNNAQINHRHLDMLTFRHLPSRTQALFLSPTHRFPRLFNSLPDHIKDSAVLNPLSLFLRHLKAYLNNPSG